MKKLIVFAVYLLVLAACSKDKNKKNPTCYWTVNGESFQSNNTYLEEGKAQTNFGTERSLENTVGFTFWFSGVPTFGTFLISNSGIQDPSTASIGIRYNGGVYGVRDYLRSELVASEYNGKGRLQFQGVWFKNIVDSTDTALVSCDFYAP